MAKKIQDFNQLEDIIQALSLNSVQAHKLSVDAAAVMSRITKQNLQGANLLGADLQVANLQGVKNAQHAKLDSKQKQLFELATSKDSELEQQAKENVPNKQKIAELEKKLKIAQQEADEKDNIQKELDELKEKQEEKQEEALDTAIKKIEDSTKKTEKMLKHYNIQSWALIIIDLVIKGVSIT